MAAPAPPSLRWDRSPEGVLTLHVAGRWRLGDPAPSFAELLRLLRAPESRPRRIAFDASGLGDWDSLLLASLLPVLDLAASAGIDLDRGGLPAGLARMLEMARAVPERKDARRHAPPRRWVTRVGEGTIRILGEGRDSMAFLGECALLFFRFLAGRARFRSRDFLLLLEEVGILALPIVGLIAFLVGAILAFVGSMQLQAFGAQIFVADLVAIAVLREMASMMTGIVLAGRTGAAYAAALGTMTVNEEIDAMRTMGLDPMEYLVLPRLLALGLMTPLLCVYADFLGILGGATVASGVLGVSFTEYIHQTRGAITLDALFSGLIKGSVYGVLVGVAGCMRGMQSGRSASAVGESATRAAVTGIVFIILSDLLLTVIFDEVGF